MKVEVFFNEENIERAMRFASLPMDGTQTPKSINRLAKADLRSHAKFLRQMNLECKVTAPLYWWTEFDTYKVGVTRMSTSTMHTLLNNRLNLDTDFDIPKNNKYSNRLSLIMKDYIAVINDAIKHNHKDSDLLLAIKTMLPSSFLYTSYVTFNYEALRRMYKDRYYHKLPQWRQFFSAFKNIPYYAEFIEAD